MDCLDVWMNLFSLCADATGKDCSVLHSGASSVQIPTILNLFKICAVRVRGMYNPEPVLCSEGERYVNPEPALCTDPSGM